MTQTIKMMVMFGLAMSGFARAWSPPPLALVKKNFEVSCKLTIEVVTTGVGPDGKASRERLYSEGHIKVTRKSLDASEGTVDFIPKISWLAASTDENRVLPEALPGTPKITVAEGSFWGDYATYALKGYYVSFQVDFPHPRFSDYSIFDLQGISYSSEGRASGSAAEKRDDGANVQRYWFGWECAQII